MLVGGVLVCLAGAAAKVFADSWLTLGIAAVVGAVFIGVGARRLRPAWAKWLLWILLFLGAASVVAWSGFEIVMSLYPNC